MTTLEAIRTGSTPDSVKSSCENLTPAELASAVARGHAVVPANRLHDLKRPCAIGGGTRVKVNANIGSSRDLESLEQEMLKLRTAVACGADTVMDLSTGPAWREILARILEKSPVPIGTVPLYQVFGEVLEKGGDVADVSPDDIFGAVEDH